MASTPMTDLMPVERRWKTAEHVCRTSKGADVSDYSFGDVQTEVKYEKRHGTAMT
jgi:hypothetical protein